MNIHRLLQNVKYTGNPGDFDTDFVTDDSRKVRAGCVFVRSKGGSFDGHTFAEKAVEIGAKLIVAERDTGVENQILVENSRQAYALMCGNLFDNPAKKLKMIGITGTNGKTTSAFLIKDLLQQMGKQVGLMGTVQNMIGSQIIPAKFTTPQPYELNALLSQMYKSGCEYAVMETSSQALAQNRLYGIKFDVGVFTNLTQDHLDYHKTMENYFDAKCLLFQNSEKIVVNYDDPYGKKVAERFKDKEVITFSDRDNTADYTARNIEYSSKNVKFLMVAKGSINRVDFPMPGEYSVHNAMGAALALIALGFDETDVCTALNHVQGVKGNTCKRTFDSYMRLRPHRRRTEKCAVISAPLCKGQVYSIVRLCRRKRQRKAYFDGSRRGGLCGLRVPHQRQSERGKSAEHYRQCFRLL